MLKMASYLLKAFLITAVLAVAASAQSVITVAKHVPATFRTIQAAVNAAQPGQIIQILDTEIYAEQVTIDGRDNSPWSGRGVTGGKNGITIRHVPDPAAPLVRPTIRFRDTQNRSPLNHSEARVTGELPGQNSNYETNGALRILHAKGITIDGIAIDGGGADPFGALNVFCPPDAGGVCFPFAHGNTAITLVAASDVHIRNSVVRNAYFGIYVKDRNAGGVFGGLPPAYNDAAIPLSNFGGAGNHLFEYNRVHNNSVGIFFESLWDLGSTVRYNLIFNNAHTVPPAIEPFNQNAGAFLFKDMYISPVAIYNNTLWNNTANFLGNWQIGGQHLIFNNIFSRSNPDASNSPYMVIDQRFPNRMHNSLFSASMEVRQQCQPGNFCVTDNEFAPGGCFIDVVRGISGLLGFRPPAQTSNSVRICNNGVPTGATQSQMMVAPGALIPGPTGDLPAFPQDANIRWLQTEGGLVSDGNPVADPNFPSLFQSLDPADTNFLHPIWDHPHVERFIRNQGWQQIGIRNGDGTIADLGAIPHPSSGRQNTLARVVPVGVVQITGTTATAEVIFEEYAGTIQNPKISFLRWIYPIPNNTDRWASDWDVITTGAVNNIITLGNNSSVQVKPGRNRFQFTIPTGFDGNGFFEIVVEGTDLAGNRVTSDVGFLPYRPINNIFDISVHSRENVPAGPNSHADGLSEVNLGDTVLLYVTARTPPLDGIIEEVKYSLRSGPETAMLCVSGCPAGAAPGSPLTEAANVSVDGAMYHVVFTRAGDETIRAAGRNNNGPQIFFGTGDITVRRIGGAAERTITYVAGGGGAITGDPVQTLLPDSQGTSVEAVPAERYQFVRWSDGRTSSVRTDAYPDKDTVITAEFARVSYHLYYFAGVYGQIVYSGGMSSTFSRDISPDGNGPQVMAVGNPGYVFYAWSDSVETPLRQDMNIHRDIEVRAYFIDEEGTVDVKTFGRVIPGGDDDIAVVAPAWRLTAEFSAGPNPVGRRSPGTVTFFRLGKRIESASLVVYDASGNTVNRVRINDSRAGVSRGDGSQARRAVGSWDLTDRKGRPVAEGTYLIRGTIVVDGRRERVSVIIGVR
jgi:hypothetical protein